MWCPKCNAASDDRFCPHCGLDLKIYADVQALKDEVDALRQLILSGTPSSAEVDAGSANLQSSRGKEGEKMPPPLPPALTKPEPEKGISGVNSAELAVGQKWLLGIGVLILIIGIGFFLKYAFDQEWIGPSVRISMGFLGGVVLLLG